MGLTNLKVQLRVTGVKRLNEALMKAEERCRRVGQPRRQSTLMALRRVARTVVDHAWLVRICGRDYWKRRNGREP